MIQTTTRNILGILGAMALSAMLAGPLHAQSAVSPEQLQFFTKSKNAILIDGRTGKSMYEKNPDEPIAPASMSKIMTQIMVFERLAEKTLSLDQEFFVSKNAWRKGGAKSGSSTMYLEPESRVKLGDLIQGAIIQSANDACIAIAENIAGTEEAFADLMTFRAREMGLTHATFKNATGLYDKDHKIAVRELALLAEYMIRKFPNYYPYYRQKSFTWNNINQPNRNPLLLDYPGADGVKTGFVKEAGYGLIGSALRNERRLILVVAGLPSSEERRQEAQKLLDWGFRQFKPFTAYAAGETIGQVRVWGGSVGAATLVARNEVRIALSEAESRQVKVELFYKGPLIAPVKKGTEIGKVRFLIEGKPVAEQAVVTGQDIAAVDSRWKRALDSLIIMALGG
ncbi:MAG TPA: D-alanyl-D-alanine carboxypeptidase family protein [Aestuariivirgaceae bacterium]|nr:D-alanyl-D-alanine carboxypeptidase family protein [Aestuariivirgaceae bacterium]